MSNLGIRIFSIICALAILLTMIVLPSPAVMAVTDGLDLATMQIVLPVSATQVEKTAATELQTYIKKITGVEVAIVDEGSNKGAGIYVGATKQASLKKVVYPSAKDEKGEAWAIKAVDGDLILCGAPRRGALYAVYHLLEDVLGVHWWNPWEEEVPSGNAIVPENYSDRGVPALEYREIYIGGWGVEDYIYYARNRMTGDHLGISEAYGGNEGYGYAHIHTFDKYFSANDLSTHPEWFPLVDGTRTFSGQLCLTNDSLKEEFAARMLAEVRKDPDVIYSVSPGDTTAFCQCDACQEEIDTYGMSGYVLRFVNEMAEAVADAGYMDTQVEMPVYSVYVDPPKGGVVPAENVMLRFAYYVDLLHNLDHANNAKYVELLQGWMEIANNDDAYYWQYVVNYNNNGVLPSMFNYGNDMTKVIEMGVNGWFAEQEQCINGDFWDMKLWLISKLMEEPVTGAEYEALMDEFIYGYYGEEAGKYIREYLYYMHEKAEAADDNYGFGTHIIGTDWLQVSDIITGYTCFEKAFAVAGNDATLLRRLRAARSGFDRVIVENYTKWESQAQEAGLTLPFTQREVGERVYQTMTEQIELRGEYDMDYSMFYPRYDRYANSLTELPDALEGVEREHILEYTPDDFRLSYSYTVVEDVDSLIGTAARLDAALQMADGIESLILSERNGIPLAVYDTEGMEGQMHMMVGTLTSGDIKANQGYQLYRLEWTVPELSGNGYLYMVSDWGVQIVQLAHDLLEFQGQTVEVCVSMKVEGTVDGSNPEDYPVYYIDRVFVLPEEGQRSHTYTTINTDYGVVKTACSVCGKITGIEQTTQIPDSNDQPENEPTQQSPSQNNTQPDKDITQKQPSAVNYKIILIIALAVLINAAIIVFAIVLFNKRKQ